MRLTLIWINDSAVKRFEAVHQSSDRVAIRCSETELRVTDVQMRGLMMAYPEIHD